MRKRVTHDYRFRKCLGCLECDWNYSCSYCFALFGYRKKLEVDYWISYKIFSGEKISLWSIDLVNIGSVPVKIYEVGLYQKSWLRKRRKKIIFMMPRDFEYESAKLPILLNPQEDATYFIAKNEWITKIKELGINQRKIGLYARDTTGKYYYRKFLLE